jgi:hypothetical protein
LLIFEESALWLRVHATTLSFTRASSLLFIVNRLTTVRIIVEQAICHYPILGHSLFAIRTPMTYTNRTSGMR